MFAHELGYGLVCSGWQHAMADAFESALFGDASNGKLCFRARGVEKGGVGGSLADIFTGNFQSPMYHYWVQLYVTGNFKMELRNSAIVIDPWPSGGAIVAPKNHSYSPQRFTQEWTYWE